MQLEVDVNKKIRDKYVNFGKKPDFFPESHTF